MQMRRSQFLQPMRTVSSLLRPTKTGNLQSPFRGPIPRNQTRPSMVCLMQSLTRILQTILVLIKPVQSQVCRRQPIQDSKSRELLRPHRLLIGIPMLRSCLIAAVLRRPGNFINKSFHKRPCSYILGAWPIFFLTICGKEVNNYA